MWWIRRPVRPVDQIAATEWPPGRQHGMPAGDVMTTYRYARVSTVRQADEGESLEVQERTIAGYALMHGTKADQVFVERGVSGSKPLSDRPQGGALLAAMQPGDTIITPKLDRMFRSTLDALNVLAQAWPSA
jgi:putative DNA-invertase from lambdoid prophage Rac